jgi:hypothetical protein
MAESKLPLEGITMQNQFIKTSNAISIESTRITIWAAYASGISAAIGLVFLVIFFSGVPVFGPLNDIAVIIQYVLLLPIMLTVHKLLPNTYQRLNSSALFLGLIGFLSVIVLQSMLVLGVIPFRQQIFLVIPAFLVGTAWFVLIERLGKQEKRLPKGLVLYILAGLVFAYPIWAYKLARNLEQYLQGGSK